MADTKPDQTGSSSSRDRSAEELLPAIYDELKNLAIHRMAQERPGITLQATALVHEAYLRLGTSKFANKAHFFHAAAEAMRRILIESARKRGRVKRGAGMKQLPMNVLDLAVAPDPTEIVAFDDAIRRLEEQTPLAAQVVRLRFYAGLTVDEAAEAMNVSPRTINREWTFARAWLFRELNQAETE